MLMLLPLAAASIITPTDGTVTVTARKLFTTCGGFGSTISTTYQIGNVPIVAVTPVVQRNNCPPYDVKVIFETVITGLSYSFTTNAGGTPTAISNSTNSALAIDPASQGQPVWNLLNAGSGKSFFDLTYVVSSTCGGAGSGLQIFTNSLSIQKAMPYPCRPAAGASAEPIAEPRVELYPNPTSGAVDVKTEANTHYQWVKVFDGQGYLRYQQQSTVLAGIQSFDLKALKPGIYLVQLFDGKHLVSQRLVKE